MPNGILFCMRRQSTMARQTQWRDNHNDAANHWRGNQTARQSQWRGIIPSHSQTKTPKGRRAASGGLFLKAPSLQHIRPSLPSSWSGEVWRGNQSVRKPQARVPPLTAGGTPAPAWGAHRPPDPHPRATPSDWLTCLVPTSLRKLRLADTKHARAAPSRLRADGWQ